MGCRMVDKIVEMKILIRWNSAKKRVDRMTEALTAIEAEAKLAGVNLIEISEDDLRQMR